MSERRMDLLSHFWTPLCAVGARGERGANAQICLSVFGASIVPDRPRLIVSLSKTNYTHDLVADTGRMAITLLSEGQVDLLEPLGLRSGRNGDKLAALAAEADSDGNPWFPGGMGAMRCEVLGADDHGDATAFLVAIRERWDLEGEAPLRWQDAQSVVGDDFLRRWAEKRAREQELARRVMVWR